MGRLHKVPVGMPEGQRKIDLPEQVQISLAEIATSAQKGLLAFSVAVGFQVLDALMDEDVNRVVGEKGKWNPERTALRHGKG